ncbi:MAG: right-handed parallel beta-helix repeat-containing protein [Calditrichia bacterium]
MKTFLLFFLTLMLICSAATAQTPAGGIITENTVWTLAQSPYVVTGNILVAESATLTIEAGVVIRFQQDKSLQVDGTLIARGNETNPILFTSDAQNPAPGDWGYIFFSDSAEDAIYDQNGNFVGGSVLEHAIVEYAGGVIEGHSGAVRMDNAHPFINFCEIRFNDESGIDAENLTGRQVITNCSIHHNTEFAEGGGIAVYYSFGSNLIISGNSISDNSAFDGGGIYLDGFDSAIVSGNTIFRNHTNGDGGGGIYVNGLYTDIFQNRIIGNTTTEQGGGGGIHVMSGIPLMIHDNIIMNNYANTGGGLYFYALGTMSVYNNIVVHNSAAAQYLEGIPGGTGGGIYVYTPGHPWGLQDPNSTAITHNAILYNVSGNASGIDYESNDDLPNQIVSNTITGNVTTASAPVYTVAMHSNTVFNHNNLFENSSECDLGNLNPQTSASLDAADNWWGTGEASDIPLKIWDWMDDGTLESTDYQPYLAEPDTSAPVSPPSDVAVTAAAGGLQIAWSPNPEGDIAGYKIYYGLQPGFIFSQVVDAGNNTSYYLDGATAADTIAVTAYDAQADGYGDMFEGHESWYGLPANLVKINHRAAAVPEDFQLGQNYPNPFNPTTVIEYRVSVSAYVVLQLFDVLGHEIKTLVNEHQGAGSHSVVLDGSGLAAGIYFYRLTAVLNEGSGSKLFSGTKKLMLVK